MSQYAFLIPGIVVIWVFLLAFRIGAYMDSKVDGDNPPSIPEKNCPPHRWRWLDQPGMENTQYMICLTCKKTPRQVGEGT